MSAQELRRLWADEYRQWRRRDQREELSRARWCASQDGGALAARMGLPTAREQLAGSETSPAQARACRRPGALGRSDTAQEYRVSLPRLELWMRYYNVNR